MCLNSSFQIFPSTPRRNVFLKISSRLPALRHQPSLCSCVRLCSLDDAHDTAKSNNTLRTSLSSVDSSRRMRGVFQVPLSFHRTNTLCRYKSNALISYGFKVSIPSSFASSTVPVNSFANACESNSLDPLSTLYHLLSPTVSSVGSKCLLLLE